MKIKKYSGELVDFEVEKLMHSLSKSGASPEAVEEIVKTIQPQIYDGMHTKDLYRLAFNHLKRKSSSFAARYSLKRALRDLGPSGYFFEKWAARIFEHMGYVTISGQHLQGYAVSHEIDVLGLKEGNLTIAECKFRNTTEARISVTTPMYFLSRFKDLEDRSFHYFEQDARVIAGWLVTNAYLTSDAIQFSEYYGIKVLSWDYPQGQNIKSRVDNAGLYPLTCLTSLTKSEKQILLESGCVLVRDLIKDGSMLERLRLAPSKKRKVLEEAEGLVDDTK